MSEEQTEIAPLLVEDEKTGDVLYVGPLEAGKAVAQLDRFVVVAELGNGWQVELCDDPDGEQVAEWGSGQTEEQAWRFALGAMFGPMDEEYDEDALRALLDEQN